MTEARVKGKVYKRKAVRPAEMYDEQTVALKKRQKAELKMLRFPLAVN